LRTASLHLSDELLYVSLLEDSLHMPVASPDFTAGIPVRMRDAGM